MPLEVGRYYRPVSRWIIASTQQDAVLQCESADNQSSSLFRVLYGRCEFNNAAGGMPGLWASSEDVELMEHEPILPNMPVNPVAAEIDTSWAAHSNTELTRDIRSMRDAVYSRMYENPIVTATQAVEPDQPKDERAKEYAKIVGHEWVPVRLCGVLQSNLTKLEYHVEEDGPRVEYKDWREREAAGFLPQKGRELNTRFTSKGELQFSWRYTDDETTHDPMYTHIPEPVQDLMKKYGAEPIEDHFLHQSRSNKSHVAFIEDEAKGKADRQTSIKMGKYLRKYYEHLTDPQVAEIASLYRKELMGEINVQFARTREEIVEVYRNGPSSCMSYDLGDYSTGGIHPVEVYATPDIGIAYIERDGRVTARTVCNMVKKQYNTIYGDSTVLGEGLELMGFEYGDLEGCSLLKLRTKGGHYVAPYLDGIQTLSDEGDYFLIDEDGAYEATSTNGLLESGHRECIECSDVYHESEMRWSDYNDGYICEDCCSEYYTYAYYGRWGHQDYIPNREHDFYEYDGEYYTGEALEYNNLVILNNGDVSHTDDCVYSEEDTKWYLTDEVSYFLNSSGDVDCTCERAESLVQPEDEEYHMLEKDCYEFDGKFYRHEENKEEAENEYQEESTEVA